MKRKLEIKLEDACKRYMNAVSIKLQDNEREKIFFEIAGIKSLIEQL